MKPVLFAGLLKHFEHKGPAEIEPKRIHTYRHTQWQADKYGIPMKYPPGHPFNSLHALRLAIAFGGTYDTVKAIFDFIWAQGRSPNDEWKVLCDTLGVPGAEVLAASEAVKTQLRDNTDEAITGRRVRRADLRRRRQPVLGRRCHRDAARLSRQSAALRVGRDEAPAVPAGRRRASDLVLPACPTRPRS